MKIIFLLISFMAITNLVMAQLKWKIKLGTKTVLQTAGENESKNVFRLSRTQIGIKSNLIISYQVAADEKDWVRNLMIDDSTGAGIAESPTASAIKQGTVEVKYTITNKKLKELLKKHKKIKLFYTSIPSDPEQAALVRVRKVHICTFSLR